MLPQTYSLGRGKKDFSRFERCFLIIFVSIGDIINTFRTSTLGLPSLTLRSGPGIVDYYKVPWTYCMSPSLVPKPDDWKNHIGMKPITGLGNECSLIKMSPFFRCSGVLFPWFSSKLPTSARIISFLGSWRDTHIHRVNCQTSYNRATY